MSQQINQREVVTKPKCGATKCRFIVYARSSSESQRGSYWVVDRNLTHRIAYTNLAWYILVLEVNFRVSLLQTYV